MVAVCGVPVAALAFTQCWLPQLKVLLSTPVLLPPEVKPKAGSGGASGFD